MQSRLEPFRLEALTDEQRRLTERIVLRRSRIRAPMDRAAEFMSGGPRAWMLNPSLGGALNQLAEEIPHLELTPRCREIAILSVGYACRSAFVLAAHHSLARKVGLSEAEVESLSTGGTPQFKIEEERATLSTVRAMAADGDLDDVQYECAASVLGTRKIFELMFLLCFFRLVALQIAVFRLSE